MHVFFSIESSKSATCSKKDLEKKTKNEGMTDIILLVSLSMEMLSLMCEFKYDYSEEMDIICMFLFYRIFEKCHLQQKGFGKEDKKRRYDRYYFTYKSFNADVITDVITFMSTDFIG